MPLHYINKTYFYDNLDHSGFMLDYYEYLHNIIKKSLEDLNLCYNISLNKQDYQFNNSNTILKIALNIEHTFVLPGEPYLPNWCQRSSIKNDNGNYYLVKIDNLVGLVNEDIVIDYSIPNIMNIVLSNHYEDFSKKLICITPRVYETYNFETAKREQDVLTTFFAPNQQRRIQLLQNLKYSNLKHINVQNCFGEELQKLFCNTKILVNIHQTDTRFTAEELRILPALLCGVIVISEKSPLSEEIPYAHLVIWTEYDNIISKTKEVLENYDKYHSKIFTENTRKLFDTLHETNIKKMKQKLVNRHFNTEPTCDLHYLAKHYALDKSFTTGFHNYIPNYMSLFNNIRKNVNTVLEIGIGSLENNQMMGKNGHLARLGYKTGNSLRCWRDYFTNANIYGIDIFEHTFNENRIFVLKADQSSDNDLLNVVKFINNPIDIIIDDGSHNEKHQVFSFMFLEKYLSKHGIYVIEDIQPGFIDSFRDLSIFDADFRQYILDNYKVRFFDTRDYNGREDDCMIAFLKK
jgi:hypothetical protein